MEQLSEEWFELRESSIGSSDAPIIMGMSPWSTPYDLWLEKTRGIIKDETYAMRRGKELEPKVRKEFEERKNENFSPKVLFIEKGIHASLDGYNEKTKYAIEIKCPSKDTHEKTREEGIPQIYYPQIQHIWMSKEVQRLDYISYYSGDMIVIPTEKDEDYIKELKRKEKEFLDCVINIVAPMISEKDYFNVLDDSLIEAAQRYEFLDKQIKLLEGQKEVLKEKLLKDQTHPLLKIGTLRLIKKIRKGTIPYSKLEELKTLDLEKYRGKDSEYWTALVSKE